ncbi:MAG: thrombospondin type 3 repeat-containing protein, partial [Desulfobulbaceae bacterium]
SSWSGTQERHGVAVWRWQIPTTGWYDLRTNFKRTDNRTTSAQYYVYKNVTINDIDNYTTGAPILYKVVNQEGPNEEAGAWYYAEFGAICMKAGDVSVLVLDARETDRSSSADAAFWTYLGQQHNGRTCAPDADGDGIVDSLDACPTQGNRGFGLNTEGCPLAPLSAATNMLLLGGKK